MIEHIEQETSGKAVQTLKKTCEKLHKQCRKEEKTDHSKYSSVLLKWLLTMAEKAEEKIYFFIFSALRGR